MGTVVQSHTRTPSPHSAMPGRLDSRVCIITGAGSGIGLESTLLFASEGAHLVLGDISQPALDRTLTLLKELKPKIIGRTILVQGDVGKESDVKHMVDVARNEFGRVDVMFNNAGIMHPSDSGALETTEDVWDLTHRINVKSVWYGCKHAIEAMRQNPPLRDSTGATVPRYAGGSIINTASFVAVMGAATPQLAYTASKGAVLAMTRELAMVHAREGIRVNALCPGPLRTPLLMDYLDTPEKRDRRLVHVPMGRFGEAIEQARGALFLASDDSSYITGQDFKVDGGLSCCYVTPEGEPALPAPKSLAPEGEYAKPPPS